MKRYRIWGEGKFGIVSEYEWQWIHAADFEELLTAIRACSEDMHLPTTRPCETCRKMTELLEEPYGCYWYRSKRENNNG